MSIEVLHRTLSGRLFHLSTTSLVKKYLVLSRLTLRPLSLSPFPLVGSIGANVNKFSVSMLLNPLIILKHSVSLPLSLRFAKENKFNSFSLFS